MEMGIGVGWGRRCWEWEELGDVMVEGIGKWVGVGWGRRRWRGY